ncbi:serine/threonine-protein kinase haspin-like [Argiope bruennichi]|uniref:serine/threonine-protein kinase haspin-like n=1 Tax=Argiope bruennichi TaxID=94029 RepID=UPI0024959357|nr:serine/threonine-protein kinase haspin-like [Argiope bruennichi]
MIVPAPILNIPLPVIAGVLAGSVRHLEIPRNIRRLIRKWNTIKRQKVETGIRSKLKKRSIFAFVKAFRNTFIAKKSSTPASHNQHISVPQRPFTSKDFQHSSDSITPEMEKVFKFCNVKNDVKFSNAISFWKQRYARKIAEGSYGEIYQFRHIDGTKRIFKCIPINGQHSMNSYENIPLSLAVPDIVSSNISLVRDRFPDFLMRAWWDYKNSPERLKDPAEHPRPDQYSESQLYLTIESSFCGEPLTMKLLQNAWVGVTIMSQIISALAVAEGAYNFEHRDLHLANILVQNQSVYCVGLDDIAKSSSDRNDSTESIWLNHKNVYKIMAEYSKSEARRREHWFSGFRLVARSQSGAGYWEKLVRTNQETARLREA